MSNPKSKGALIGAMLANLMLAAGITVDPMDLNPQSFLTGFVLAISAGIGGALIGYAYVAVWSRWRAK